MDYTNNIYGLNLKPNRVAESLMSMQNCTVYDTMYVKNHTTSQNYAELQGINSINININIMLLCHSTFKHRGVVIIFQTNYNLKKMQ